MPDVQTLSSLAKFSEHGFGFLMIGKAEFYVRVSVYGASARKYATRIDIIACDCLVPVRPKKKKTTELGRVLQWWSDPHLKRHLSEIVATRAERSLDEPQTVYLNHADVRVLCEPLKFIN